MTNLSTKASAPVIGRSAQSRSPQPRRRAIVPLLLFLAVVATACSPRDAVEVTLHSEAGPRGVLRGLRISAEVAGDQSDLRYKWYTVAGACDPQESKAPSTDFRFAARTTRDRVTVEVWRGDKQVGRGDLDVELDGRLARLASEPLPKVEIEITTIPPYEPAGGPDTRADISGRVRGEIDGSYRVLIYARADAWYIQPMMQGWHPILPDSTFASWTHTGSSYAAMVVRPDFEPFPRLDLLPTVGGDVLARTIVEGRRP